MLRFAVLLSTALWLAAANAHLAPFAKGMYCANGPQNNQDLNSYAIVSPLWQLQFGDWWFHHNNGCDQYPPPEGEFLELPAGKSFTVEIASNRAKTTLSYNGQYTSEWPDGGSYPEDYNVASCITSPNMHAQNQSMAAGTAFAISYNSELSQVTPDNLVVFSVRYHTPWKRVTSYDVPAAMPPCPAGGCMCAWGWIPNGCGEPNMYHTAFRCQVTGSTSTTPLATPKPPVWCEGNPGGCTKGAKQMLYWNQASGNNIQVSGYDLSGQPKSPAYNSKCGFDDGAQNDIFAGPPSSGSSKPAASSPSPVPANPGAAAQSVPAASHPESTPSPAAPSPSPAAASASSAASSSSSNSSTPNKAPSCKKSSKKRRSSENATTLVKKSNVAAHRRHHARQTW
ncbi:hypothetical protein CVT26_012227 [Gymnopilus dilepis]|uniref:Uncharacterized protein n=1 Tax=Gymnopilus dilepis TaxID=231916 RepID=A0A409YQ62_9AGAR|nr:hypothetical protein CVT26_012227 [Gymnopilus dilepis]